MMMMMKSGQGYLGPEKLPTPGQFITRNHSRSNSQMDDCHLLLISGGRHPPALPSHYTRGSIRPLNLQILGIILLAGCPGLEACSPAQSWAYLYYSVFNFLPLTRTSSRVYVS